MIDSFVELWVIRNLVNYHNCLVPRKLIKLHGSDALIKELTELGFIQPKIVFINRSYVIEMNGSTRNELFV